MTPGIGLALGAAAAFGACDFVAGVAARRTAFWWVALVSLVASVLGAWVLVGLRGDAATSAAWLWGPVAGVGAAVGSVALYRGYGHDQMAVAGPLSAVGAAALPAVVGIAWGDRLSTIGVVGVIVAMPGIWLMSSTRAQRVGIRAGVPDGLVSGVGFAIEFIGLERAGAGAGLWPVALSQTTALVVVTAVVVWRRPKGGLDRRSGSLSAVAGLLSLAATTAYFLSAQAGLLTVAAVITSLYPGVTVGLAAALLGERPSRRQGLGLALGALAVVLVSLA